MISLVIAESALEMVPPELYGHPAVRSHARRTRGGKRPHMLLDNSWHYAAMKGMPDAARRGRPDLVHLALVTATSAPLYRLRRALEVYVHTADGCMISLGPGVRIPKSYHRFAGLVEALYETGVIEATTTRGSHTGGGSKGAGCRTDDGGGGDDSDDDDDDDGDNNTVHHRGKDGAPAQEETTLMRLERNSTFADLVRTKKFSKVVGLSSLGALPDSPRPYEYVAQRVPDDAAIVIGGFQKGHFSDGISGHLDEVYAVDTSPLEAHVVIARILYEYEKKPFM
ncbi:MAG: ribosome biogenesis protein [Nitrosopumilaceae archaeon]|nr:ribosome biogenesis protein [Nitrosopumilaceae archaeon]